MGTLYIVATPIGNLGDITLRAIETLKEVDLILCEDTRVTRKLLAHYKIAKPLLSYHQHSKEDVREKIFQLLLAGKTLALVTDAGTPGVSDPGNELIAYLLAEEKEVETGKVYSTRSRKITITPIPGPSAVAALASVTGIPMDKFLFLGYPPHKKGRKKFFEEVVQSAHPVVFYESPFRILKSLREIYALNSNLFTVIGRELTKQFEIIYRGTIDEVIEKVQKDKVKGEFVIVVYQEK